MKRVLIIGSNGAGKSTFSYQLAQRTGLPLLHIDQFYWRGSWDVTPQAEFDRAVLDEARKSRWIIEGNNLRSLSARLKYADTVIIFEFPPLLCVKSIIKRELCCLGRARPDMPPSCKSRLTFGFLKTAFKFNQKQGITIKTLLASAPWIKVIYFTSRLQVQAFLKTNPHIEL